MQGLRIALSQLRVILSAIPAYVCRIDRLRARGRIATMSDQNNPAPVETYIEGDNADVIIDGRAVPVPVAFTADDDTLWAALAPHCAWIASKK